MCLPNSNNQKIWKRPYLKKNLRVRVVIDNADTRSNIFAKTKKFAKPFSPVHMGPMSNLFSKKVLHCWRTVTNNFLFFMIFCMLRVHREGDIAKFPTDLAFRKFKSKLFKNVCRKSEANFQSVSLL